VVGSQSRARAAIEDTLDYRNIISTVQQLVKTSKFALVERLATAIAESILESCVAQVQVRLSKPATIPDFTGKITIELTRERQNSSCTTQYLVCINKHNTNVPLD